MSDSESDGLKEGSVDSGYGGSSPIERSTGEDDDMRGATEDVDERERASASTSSRSDNDSESESSAVSTETASIDEPETTADDAPSGEWTWGDRAEGVKSEASPRPYVPPDTEFPYFMDRSEPVTKGLETRGVRIRPELDNALEEAVNHSKTFFSEDKTFATDYHEAALTVALWHHDEVLALMAEFGHGRHGYGDGQSD
jgi:hypothetical protein